MDKRIKKQFKSLFIGIAFIICIFSSTSGFGQSADTVKWLTFEQLDEALKTNPKKVFINFYASWCTYCHEMDRVAFRDAEVIALLNEDYYPVKMNIETTDTIAFGGKDYWNKRSNKRNPIHEIALLMATRKDKPFTLPAMILLNEEFEATARYFQYLTPQQLLDILKAK